MSIKNRYDFVLLFDVKDGNPNGDPDAGNLPRVDPQDGRGLVTDVSIKRKIRNYVAMKKKKPEGGFEPRFDIYVKEKAVLGRAHFDAFNKLGINLGQDITEDIPEELVDAFGDLALPEGMEIDTDEDGNSILKLSGVALDKKEAQKWLKDLKPPKPIKDILTKALGKLKARKPTQDETENGRVQMCHDFFDIRTFGAVLSLKTAPNCGQVRGPVQLTFARSIDPIISSEHAITRCAVATDARGEMTTRGLYVFKHDSELGNAPAHTLFDRIRPKLKPDVAVPRAFGDYEIAVDESGMPQGVQLMKLC